MITPCLDTGFTEYTPLISFSSNFDPPFSGTKNIRYNLEGILLYTIAAKFSSYIQLFRNGGIEIFTTYLYDKTNNTFNLHRFEELLINYTQRYFSFSNSLNINSTYMIYISLFDLRNVLIPTIMNMFTNIDNKFSRNEILLPGVIIENPDTDIRKLLEPTFDILWQAAGLEGSPSYKDGV